MSTYEFLSSGPEGVPNSEVARSNEKARQYRFLDELLLDPQVVEKIKKKVRASVSKGQITNRNQGNTKVALRSTERGVDASKRKDTDRTQTRAKSTPKKGTKAGVDLSKSVSDGVGKKEAANHRRTGSR